MSEPPRSPDGARSGKGWAFTCGVASPLHLSIKTAEVLIQGYSHLTDSAHTQSGHTLTTHLETHTEAHLVKPAKMPCVSSQLDQMVKMPCSYSSVIDKIHMVRSGFYV